MSIFVSSSAREFSPAPDFLRLSARAAVASIVLFCLLSSPCFLQFLISPAYCANKTKAPNCGPEGLTGLGTVPCGCAAVNPLMGMVIKPPP